MLPNVTASPRFVTGLETNVSLDTATALVTANRCERHRCPKEEVGIAFNRLFAPVSDRRAEYDVARRQPADQRPGEPERQDGRKRIARQDAPAGRFRPPSSHAKLHQKNIPVLVAPMLYATAMFPRRLSHVQAPAQAGHFHSCRREETDHRRPQALSVHFAIRQRSRALPPAASMALAS